MIKYCNIVIFHSRFIFPNNFGFKWGSILSTLFFTPLFVAIFTTLSLFFTENTIKQKLLFNKIYLACLHLIWMLSSCCFLIVCGQCKQEINLIASSASIKFGILTSCCFPWWTTFLVNSKYQKVCCFLFDIFHLQLVVKQSECWNKNK